MDKQNKQVISPQEDEDDIEVDTDTVVSSMDCTGLIQTPPASEAEAEAYTDLYTIPKPQKGKPHNLQKEEKTL